MPQFLKTTLIFICITFSTGGLWAEKITILVNPQSFPGIEEAAYSEKNVNWWDSDLTDDRACTECFAAVELEAFLSVVTDYNKSDITLQSAKELPPNGNVFLLGSKNSNPLIASYDLPQANSFKTDDSFLIWAHRQNDRTITVIQGKDRVGTLYGVYSYLEQLGFRFYGLGNRENPRAGKNLPINVLIQQLTFSEKNPNLPAISTIEQNVNYSVPSHGTVYPDKNVELPQSIEIIENPSFLTRGFWAWEKHHGNEEFFLWMARNKMNLWTAADENIHLLKKFGIYLTGGGHEIFEFFLNPESEYPYNHPKLHGDENKPEDPYIIGKEYKGDINNNGKLSYFEAHPEWFALIEGSRSNIVKNGHGDNYCTSNKDAAKELTKNLMKSLIEGQYRYMDIITLWPLDNGRWCECENCFRQGNYTDRFFIVVDTVLKAIKNARQHKILNRCVQVASCAYQETLAVPTHPLPEDFDYTNHSLNYFPIQRCYVHSLSDPACSEINKFCLDRFEKWCSTDFFKGSIFITEYFNVSAIHSLPIIYTKIIASDIPWYYKKGARHFSYMHSPARLWGTWTLNQCLLAKFLWGCKTDLNSFLDEYFQKYYPTTSENTRRFYENLEQAFANIKAWKHYVGFDGIIAFADQYKLYERLASETTPLFPKNHLHYESHHPLTNDGPDFVDMMDFLNSARKYIDASLIQCTNKIEKARLLEDERRFRYGEQMANFYYHLVRTAILHRRGEKKLAANEFARLQPIAIELEAITDLVQVSSSHSNKKNGLDASRAEKAYEFYKKIYANNKLPVR